MLLFLETTPIGVHNHYTIYYNLTKTRTGGWDQLKTKTCWGRRPLKMQGSPTGFLASLIITILCGKKRDLSPTDVSLWVCTLYQERSPPHYPPPSFESFCSRFHDKKSSRRNRNPNGWWRMLAHLFCTMFSALLLCGFTTSTTSSGVPRFDLSCTLGLSATFFAFCLHQCVFNFFLEENDGGGAVGGIKPGSGDDDLASSTPCIYMVKRGICLDIFVGVHPLQRSPPHITLLL